METQSLAELEQDRSQPEPRTFAPPAALYSKKILITTESLGPINGVTRATQYLIEYFIKHKVKLAVVAPEFEKPENSPLRLLLPLIRVGGLPLFYNPDLRLTYPFRTSKIFQRTFRPDVIYLASPATLGLQIWWQLRQQNIPMVANFQTDLAFYSRLMLPGLLGKFAGDAIDWLTGLYYRDPAIKMTLCPSSSSRDYLLKLGVSPEKIRLVGRGVDCVFFNNQKRSESLRQKLAPNDEVLLLCVSRVSFEKGFDFLAEAYAEISKRAKERGLSQKFRLVVTGGNSNHLIEQNIQGYFEKRGLDTHFSGPLSGEPLAQMYASADIFVYPSVTETFGQVIQEAMASGLPVVARREGGPADIVLSDETGYLAEPNDVSAFADYTLKLIEDAALRHRMSQTARALAENRSWDGINQQIAEILAEFAN